MAELFFYAMIICYKQRTVCVVFCVCYDSSNHMIEVIELGLKSLLPLTIWKQVVVCLFDHL